MPAPRDADAETELVAALEETIPCYLRSVRQAQDAAAHLVIARDDILFVSDNPEADIVGATKSGMQTAWISCGKDWPAELADNPPQHTVDSLHELVRLIEGDK